MGSRTPGQNIGTSGSDARLDGGAEAEAGKGADATVAGAGIAEGDKPIDEQDNAQQNIVAGEAQDPKDTDEVVSDKILDVKTGALTDEALDASLDRDKAFVGEGTDEDGNPTGDGEFVAVTDLDDEPIHQASPLDADDLVRHPGDVYRRKDNGKVAYAPPGTYNAAINGVQQDAAGHFESVGATKSDLTGTRV